MTTEPSSVSRVLGEDHRDLDGLWAELEATPAHDPLARRERFDRFRSGLLVHIAVEEEYLFPILEAADPTGRALVARLLEEHAGIRHILDRFDRELAGGVDSLKTEGFELANALGEHNAREENLAYPWFDDHLTPAQMLEAKDRLRRHDQRGGTDNQVRRSDG